jgi:hypothetical protein
MWKPSSPRGLAKHPHAHFIGSRNAFERQIEALGFSKVFGEVVNNIAFLDQCIALSQRKVDETTLECHSQ